MTERSGTRASNSCDVGSIPTVASIFASNAGMAELVDALVFKTMVLTDVRVQIPLPALYADATMH